MPFPIQAIQPSHTDRHGSTTAPSSRPASRPNAAAASTSGNCRRARPNSTANSTAPPSAAAVVALRVLRRANSTPPGELGAGNLKALNRGINAFADEVDAFSPHQALGGWPPRRISTDERPNRSKRLICPEPGHALTMADSHRYSRRIVSYQKRSSIWSGGYLSRHASHPSHWRPRSAWRKGFRGRWELRRAAAAQRVAAARRPVAVRRWRWRCGGGRWRSGRWRSGWRRCGRRRSGRWCGRCGRRCGGWDRCGVRHDVGGWRSGGGRRCCRCCRRCFGRKQPIWHPVDEFAAVVAAAAVVSLAAGGAKEPLTGAAAFRNSAREPECRCGRQPRVWSRPADAPHPRSPPFECGPLSHPGDENCLHDGMRVSGAYGPRLLIGRDLERFAFPRTNGSDRIYGGLRRAPASQGEQMV